MALIGMADAALKAQMTRDGLRRALLADSDTADKIVMITPKAAAIEEDIFAAWLAKRKEAGREPGAGRPKGAKNKPRD